MRSIIYTLIAANLLLAALGLAGVFEPEPRTAGRFDPEVPGFRGRLLELADDDITPDPFPLLPATGVCFVARGFVDAVTAEQAARRWLALGRTVTLMRGSLAGQVSGYQVVTRVLPNRDERVRLQRQLESLGFEARLIAGGSNLDRVSLGVYSDAVSAQRVLARLRASGFDGEQIELRDESWEDVVAGPLSAQPEPMELTRSGASAENQSCAAIAASYSRH